MANPVRSRAELLANTPDGAYRRLVLRDAEAARRVIPGHFATLACTDSARLLRRAYSIHRADVSGGMVELVVAPRGAGSSALAATAVGERLDLIAPLGTPFPLPDGPVSALLVGDGDGAVPLFGLGEAIRRRGGQLGFILGAATADRLFGVEQARALTQDVLLVTEDGSAGLTGRPLDPLAQAIQAIDATVVYACGPTPLLAEVTVVARELGARCWTALREPMACGVGICDACVLPVVGGDGVSRLVRSCTEGPVFDGERVRWADIDTVPADLALGGGC